MTQPTALFLADILEDAGKPADIAEKCAAELRRLHAELERCKQVCAATAEGWRSDAALAEPVQEPVAWIEHEWAGTGLRKLHFEKRDPTVRDEVVNPVWTPLYTAPPQRVPLTREEAIALWADKSDGPSNGEIVSYCRAIERAHGII